MNYHSIRGDSLRRVFLIDVENVGFQCFDDLSLLSKNDTMLLFMPDSKACPVSMKALQKFRETECKIEFVEVFVGQPEALDFQLCAKLGELVRTASKTKYYVISRDLGYLPLSLFYSKKAISVHCAASVESAIKDDSLRQQNAREIAEIEQKSIVVSQTTAIETVSQATTIITATAPQTAVTESVTKPVTTTVDYREGALSIANALSSVHYGMTLEEYKNVYVYIAPWLSQNIINDKDKCTVVREFAKIFQFIGKDQQVKFLQAISLAKSYKSFKELIPSQAIKNVICNNLQMTRSILWG